MDAKLVCETG